MKLVYLSIFFLLINQFVEAQELTIQQMAELRSVHNEGKMQAFMDNNPGLNAKVVFYNSFEKLSPSDSLLFLLGLSGVRETRDEDGKLVYYKLFETSTSTNYRVRTIFFDGTKMNVERINEIRKEIVANIEGGKSFESQYDKYNMDERANHGDLGWTNPEALLEPFTSLVKINPVGKVYTVDIPYMNWYYVAENIAAPKELTKKKFLKVSLN
jgi:parvulin-like peptidyl-prolyl isomerase|tara:strand:- start:4809 stop:5444 length:636 start_codon:yes stop_codon:yes gene_type:complete